MNKKFIFANHYKSCRGLQIRTMERTIKKDKYSNWDGFLVELQSKGRFIFTFDELRTRFDLSEETLLQVLYRYKSKKQVAQIRKGFYAIIPPEYSKQGMLPPYFFIDDLMKSLNKLYYVALLSAAAIYGAAHQQPMEFFVIAESPAPRDIKNNKLKITFLSKNDWVRDGVTQQKTNAGYMNVSLPELTALDFFDYTRVFGINRIVSVLQELVEKMKITTLVKIAKHYTNTAAIQRLGYVLETELLQEKLANYLWQVLNQRNFFPIPLSPQKAKKGDANNRWKVIKNMEIESDL
ncbi:hypothetical protein EZS27_009565 [termite gut metagenome]|uniref:AbiEi antitoxin C-terminal domain-containing protein n=1 Tax=termite gut metagenome TaxID=433724 RepID=A0A5J4SBP2_9ZZZZ